MLALKSVLSSVTDGLEYTETMVIKTEHEINYILTEMQQPLYFGCLTLLVTEDFTHFFFNWQF